MITIQSRIHVDSISGMEIFNFLINPTDRELGATSPYIDLINYCDQSICPSPYQGEVRRGQVCSIQKVKWY
jgi:hypothetical protein